MKNPVNQVKSSKKDPLFFIFVRSLYKTISIQFQENTYKDIPLDVKYPETGSKTV